MPSRPPEGDASPADDGELSGRQLRFDQQFCSEHNTLSPARRIEGKRMIAETPTKQRLREILLQATDVPADRRLRNMQLARSLSKAQPAGRSFKRTQGQQ